MKKIIFLLSILLISNNCLAAGSSNDSATEIDLYKAAKKLILRAKKLEKKDNVMVVDVNSQNKFSLFKIAIEREYRAITEKITAWWSTNGVPAEGYASNDIPSE